MFTVSARDDSIIAGSILFVVLVLFVVGVSLADSILFQTNKFDATDVRLSPCALSGIQE